MSQPQTPPPDPARESSFWRTLPGVMTAVAAMITALVGAAAFLYQVAGPDDGHGAVDENPPATRRTLNHPPTGGSDSGDADPARPLDLLFTNDGVDLDADPPVSAPEVAPDMDIYDGDGSIESYPIWHGLARWSQPGTPSRDDCVTLLRDFAIEDAPFTRGSAFCVRTRGQRHYAFVQFVAQVEGGWRIRGTIWPGDV